jgi:hypothetical protein
MATKKKTAKRKVKATSKRKASATGTRRTRDPVSKLAGKWMAVIRQIKRDNGVIANEWTLEVPLPELGAMCGSLMNQDEHRGSRGK